MRFAAAISSMLSRNGWLRGSSFMKVLDLLPNPIYLPVRRHGKKKVCFRCHLCVDALMNLEHPAACLTHGLMRAARTLARGFEAEATKLGLSAPQFTALARLAGMGPMTVSQIAAAVMADRTTMTRNLAVMAQKGWIAESEGEDRREHVWSLTGQGRSVLTEAMPIWAAWQASLVARLGPEEADALLVTLNRLASP
jgi:DNA-binding MarR family transcriptional regulator